MHKLLFTAGMILLLSLPTLADEPPPFGGGSPDPIPVDGGASYLLAAGAVYGYKKLKARRQRNAK